MSHLALVMLVLASPDGGVADLYSDCPVAERPAVQVDGGWFLPDPLGDRLACRTKTCEAYVASLENQPAPGLALVVGVVVGALAVGVAAGFALGRVGK